MLFGSWGENTSPLRVPLRFRICILGLLVLGFGILEAEA